MYKATVLYGRPQDSAGFLDHYERVHIPLARKIPDIVHWTVTTVDPNEGAVESPWFLTAELYATSRAALLAAFATPAGRAAADDVNGFATGGAQFLFGFERVISTSSEFYDAR